MSRIDAYLDALGTASAAAGDIVPWPMHLGQVAPCYGDLEALDLFDRLDTLAADHVADRVVADLFVGTSSPKTLLTDLVIGLKVAGVPPDARVWFVERIFDAMASAESGDIFCRDGAHRALSDVAAQQLVDRLAWHSTAHTAGRELARASHRLSGAAQALIWALYFYGWTDIGFVIHGPYDVVLPDGRRGRLVVRDFLDLRPEQLWPAMAAFAHATLRVLAVYAPDTDLRLDVFNHLTHRVGLLDACLATYADVDGVATATVADVDQARTRIGDALLHRHQAIESMSPRQLLAKFVDSRYYALRGWRAHFGDDWRPPAEVARRVCTSEITEEPSLAPQDWSMLRHAFDPRTDVMPGS